MSEPEFLLQALEFGQASTSTAKNEGLPQEFCVRRQYQVTHTPLSRGNKLEELYIGMK